MAGTKSSLSHKRSEDMNFGGAWVGCANVLDSKMEEKEPSRIILPFLIDQLEIIII